MAEKNASSKQDWIEGMARWGLASVGVSFALVGFLAFKLAIGLKGAETNRAGALAQLSKGGWGSVVLVLIGVGFAGYATWRIVMAVTGEKVEDGDDRGAWKRVGDVARGLLYAGLTFTTLKLAFGGSSASAAKGSRQQQSQTGTVLHWPGGRVLVIGIGLAFIGTALWNGYRAVSRKYEDQLKTWSIPRSQKRAIMGIAAAGLFSRLVIFGIIGWFLIRSAVSYDAKKAVGLDGALRVVSQQPFGRILLGIVALGLVCYAAFRLVEARYRKV